MANIDDFKLGDVVTFNVFPTALLGTGFSRVKVLAILDMDTAKQWIDPVAQHINVYPTLPNGTPDSPDEYYYLKVKLSNGEVTCLGLPWIDGSTIVVHENSTMRFTVADIAATDVDKIITALAANGYTAVSVEKV